ncbi:DUF7533 family protein [Haloglomus halophilum]|uniref:DUF7533 family protein n=1 Tax=Haloglomus halophilum TaxID=2962672 RepID=UPI0020C96526|nr:hypothetical protein [Haloglomus halophilum]
MARSILGTVGLALTLAFALPVAYLGVEFLLDGKTNQGLLFLALAALMVGIQEYVTTPMDLPGEIAGKVLGTAVKEPDDGSDAGDTGTGAEDARPETGGDDGATEDEPLIPDAEGKKGR